MKQKKEKLIKSILSIVSVCVLTLVSMGARSTYAETRYVNSTDSNCNDAGTCDLATPCCTIQRAVDLVIEDNEDDSIIVKEGNYDGFVVYKNNITVIAADGEHPLVNGYEVVVPHGSGGPDIPTYIVVGASGVAINGFTINGYGGPNLGIDVGIYVGGNKQVTLQVDNSTRFTKTEANRVVIINNTIAGVRPVNAIDRGYGIFVNGAGDIADGNATNLTIAQNTFSQNHRGIGILGDVYETHIHHNDISSNDKCDHQVYSGHGIGRYYLSGLPVYAEYNWWGNASGPSDTCQASPVIDACDFVTGANGTGDEIFFTGGVCFTPWCINQGCDSDRDGSLDGADNCLQKPNGPLLGTCTWSEMALGMTCNSNGECGPGGVCSLNQEDTDGDRAGDACDEDDDNDGIEDRFDNCSFIPNGPELGTCYSWSKMQIGSTTCTSQNDCEIGEVCSMSQEDNDIDDRGDVCDNCRNYYNPDQLDTSPPQGNGIGDACDCEGNFDCDQDVDAGDVTTFLTHFGRSQYNRPCTNGDPCSGDFECDGDVDATDVTKFLEDFGRSQYNNPCPACNPGISWCNY